MRRLTGKGLAKAALILAAGTLLLAHTGCTRKTTASGSSKTVNKKKIRCSSCKSRTVSYSMPGERSRQHPNSMD